MDGSVNHLMGAVEAAFVCEGQTAVFRLPNGCSSTQAELVAIGRAMNHALGSDNCPMLIHCDAIPAIRSLLQDAPLDNVSLLTSIQAGMVEIERAGRRVHISFIHSHSCLAGNKAVDRAAGKATLLSPRHVRCPPNCLASKKRCGNGHCQGDPGRAGGDTCFGFTVRIWVTNTGARQIQPGLNRREASNIYRI